MDFARLPPAILADPRLAAPAGKPVLMQVCVPAAPLRSAPSPTAPLATQLLFGEFFRVSQKQKNWAKGQAEDFYVGYVPDNALAQAGAPPSHHITARQSALYAAPEDKAEILMALPLGAKFARAGEQGRFFRCQTGGFIPIPHCAPLPSPPAKIDRRAFIAAAENLLGAPYLYGGRSALAGLDCSALLQLALAQQGFLCLRDADLQEQTLAFPAPPADLQRGDMLFWRGHAALVSGADVLLHANAFHMAVAQEPLAPALARLEQAAGPLRSVRRF